MIVSDSKTNVNLNALKTGVDLNADLVLDLNLMSLLLLMIKIEVLDLRGLL